MEQIQYIGEHLLPGQIGHFAIVLGFVASLTAAVAYFFATQRSETSEFESWRRIGRGAFIAHGAAIFAIIGVIFYVMVNKYYEYQYAWAHVSDELQFKYVFAAFWEGQEGSFLLWMFWHVILGILLIISAKEWESPTMAVLALVQVFINSMILGIYFFGVKIGVNPTLLLRDTMDAPIFANADYVSLIKGNGLNPLLQNWWMTIHPPTLFFGFASTTIPFAYAIAGLWTKKHNEWLKAAMPWALMSAAILGTGIVMGGAWAYEALSFGGYWAWDPVENMSLVPWLILVGGIHTNLIAKSTGHSVRSTYVYYILSFLLILYSTFLTRSGVLGETSVHAFTEMGLETQLVLFILFFLGLSAVLLAMRYRQIPTPAKEEPTASKEFWMFIGTLILLFSALIITASTSLPVYNKIMQLFDPLFEGRVITDQVTHHNKYQLWIGVFIWLLTGITQYLRFREINFTKHLRKFSIHTGIALVVSIALTFLITQWIQAKAWQYWLLLFSGIFTAIANLDYIITYLKGNLKIGGSALSHLGFGLMIIGIMASGLNKQYISSNPFVMNGIIEGADDESMERNILLFKGSTTLMSGYEVTYTEDTLVNFTRTFTVNYKRRNKEGNIIEEFNLYPNILYDKSFTKIAASNPSTKQYWNKDVFTHIRSLPQVEIDMEFRRQREDSLHYRLYEANINETFSFYDTVQIKDQDTFVLKRYDVQVEKINYNPSNNDYEPQQGDVTIGASIIIKREDEDSTYIVEPMLAARGQLVYSYPVQINDLSTKLRLNDAIFNRAFIFDGQLNYKEYNLKQGDKVIMGDLEIELMQLVPRPEHPDYQPQQGDIALGAMLNVKTKDGKTYLVKPIYLIRGSQGLGIKDVIKELGLNVGFSKFDPATETAQFFMAQAEQPKDFLVPIEIATDSLRSDYIVLEAIEFPGINFFWIGTTLMMIGLTVSMLYRIRQKYAING
ncbi:MAG: cytochrome c biogenesis protein CcsA [Saprospiraceae bacterium]|nr:cytochrome c biogenesis protein CcsA [Saprospiraceae bacterium]